MIFRALFIAVLACSITPANAADSVRVDVQMVSIPIREALRLVPQLRRPDTFASAAEHVQALLKSGEATLENWLHAEGSESGRVSTESYEEVKYPTDWSTMGCFPPQYSPLGQEIMNEVGGITYEERLKRNKLRELNEKRRFVDFYNPPTPLALETRNTGATLFTDVEIDRSSNRLTFQIEVERITCEGFYATTSGTPGPPAYNGVAQPRFNHYKIRSNLSLANNGGALLGTLVLPQPQPRVLLFLLHAGFRP
jgi:hypothetical protein